MANRPWLVALLGLAVGFAACWAIVVLPAGGRAAKDLAAADAKYSATQKQLDASTIAVHELTDELAAKDSQLRIANDSVQLARKQAGDIAADFKRFRNSIDAGASGLSDDERTATELAGLIKGSLDIVGKLQGGN